MTKTRKFDGRVYTYHDAAPTKAGAEKIAKWLKASTRFKHVRRVRVPGGYQIYKRV